MSNDNKKWVIGRMESFLTVNLADIESREQKTSQIFHQISESIIKSRNIIMGIVGFVASIFLGLTALSIINSSILELLLPIDIGIGIVFFFLD